MESVESFRVRFHGAAISTYTLIMVLVPLKLWCRKRTGGWRNMGLDDVVTVLSLGFVNIFFWLCLIPMRSSLGRQADELALRELIDFLFYIFWAQALYVACIALIKFSILAFYWRLFSVSARIPIWVVSFMVFAWFVITICLLSFACKPIRASWDITITTAKCMPIEPVYLGASVVNVVTDFILILMPIPYVWRLHAPTSQRLVLVGMFLLGIFVAVVSVVRLHLFLGIPIASSANVTYNFRTVILWSMVEINIGLTCACLPSLKPLVGMLGLNKFLSFASTGPSNGTPGPSDTRPSYMKSGNSRGGRKKGATGGMFSTLAGLTKIDSDEEGYRMMDHQSTTNGKNQTEVELTRASEETDHSGAKNPGGINVRRDWAVSVDPKPAT